MLRSHFAFVAALGLLAGVAVPACSDDESPSAEFIHDYCDLMMPCCAQAGLSADAGACRELLSAFSFGSSFNQSSGDKCLAAMRAASSNPDFCNLDDDIVQDDGACEAVFSTGSSGGSVAPGGACESDFDCASTAQGEGECHHHWEGEEQGWTCVAVADGQAGSTPCIGTRDGAMTSYTYTGRPPLLGYVCDAANGVYCDQESTECTAMKTVGEACSYADRCVEAAYCNSEAGTCEARKPIGADCSIYTSECESSAYCSESGQCAAKRTNGESCTSYEQCMSNSCNDNVCAPDDLGLMFICGS